MIELDNEDIGVFLCTVDELRRKLQLYLDCVEKYVFEGSKVEEEQLQELLEELNAIDKLKQEPKP